ncbi:MAG: hypothetical protein AB7S26_14195 [Sandaracinaceae bacterium]
MSEATHMHVYQRFFAVLISVLPGLNLVIGVSAFILWLFADAIEIEWGWAIGIAAVVFATLFILWIFIGLGVQKWAEEKPMGMLLGMNMPFILIDLGLMLWLFWQVVINAPSLEESTSSGSAALLVSLAQMIS